MARTRWRTSYPGAEPDLFWSEGDVYEFVDALRRSWVAGAPGSVGGVTVQENDGSGWKSVDHIDFATEEAA